MKLITGSFLFAGLIFGQANSPGNMNDAGFASAAAIGGMTEVELGKLAVQKASADVKSFGQRMVDDHSRINEQLKGLAAKDNFALPANLDAKHQATVNRFSKMSGTVFDRAYMREMVRDHEEDAAAFRNEANNGSNQDLKNFASSVLPTVEDHLHMAQKSEQQMQVTSRVNR